MKKTEVTLETMIKTYAKATGKDSIFISILKSNDQVAKLLELTKEQMIDLVYGYVYVTDF